MEDELSGDFSRLLRSAMMAGMQVRESVMRRQQQAAQEQQARQRALTEQQEQQHRREQRVARSLQQEAHQGDFWKLAPNARIADSVIVAGYLAERGHPEAEAARQTMHDHLRNRWGINIEDMTRDHPTSREDLRRALLHALDDHRQLRADAAEDAEVTADADRTVEGETAEAGEVEQEPGAASPTETDHQAKAGQYQGEVALDERNARLAESQSYDQDATDAKKPVRVTDKATEGMKTAAQSFPTDVRQALNDRRGPAASQRRAKVHGQPRRRGTERDRGR